MSQDRAEELNIQNSLARGKRNAAVAPQIEAWCESIQVRLESYGMIAQMTRLPVGMMEVTCPHAKGQTMSAMNLTEVGTYFILGNCRDYAFHKERSPSNLGRLVFEEEKKIEAERQAAPANEIPSEGDKEGTEGKRFKPGYRAGGRNPAIHPPAGQETARGSNILSW